MPFVSAGLAIDPSDGGQSRLVYPPSFPYTRNFYFSDSVWWAVMELDVATSYDTYAQLADVRIGGFSKGQIPPRPFGSAGGELLPTVLGPFGLGGGTGTQLVEIVPPPGEWLIVAHARIHYFQWLTL
jgi:hypothetical protein